MNDAGLLKRDADILIDQNKIRRAKSRVMRQTCIDEELNLRSQILVYILWMVDIIKQKEKTIILYAQSQGESILFILLLIQKKEWGEKLQTI